MDSIQKIQSSSETHSICSVGTDPTERQQGDSVKLNSKKPVWAFLFSFYRNYIKQFLKIFGHAGCRFEPSCSEYAERLIDRESNPKNFGRIFIRISRCNAWTTPFLTFDPPYDDYLQKKI